MSTHAFVPTALLPTRAALHAPPSTAARGHAPALSHRALPSPHRHRLPSTTPPSAPSPAKPPSRILLWFHTDLRLHDNPALFSAARAASLPAACLVPVAAGAALDPPARPLLAELKALLRDAGSDLIALPGPAVADVLLRLCKKLNLNAVYFNRSVLPHRVAVETIVQKRLREAGIAVEAFWGNAMHPPTDDAVKKARGKEDAKYALTGMAARLAKGVAAPEKAPQRLPAFPRAAKQVAGQIPVHPKIGGGTTRAVAVMKRMDRSTEMLAIERTPDLAVQIKLFLDYGALSPKMVAQHAVTVTGAWKGRTFSELVWREYVCFAAHRGSGVAVKQTVAV